MRRILALLIGQLIENDYHRLGPWKTIGPQDQESLLKIVRALSAKCC